MHFVFLFFLELTQLKVVLLIHFTVFTLKNLLIVFTFSYVSFTFFVIINCNWLRCVAPLAGCKPSGGGVDMGRDGGNMHVHNLSVI